ncbi:uncharacterized protein EDB91DRAFT_1253789 [Suillus paluster]|uniref:uncharacterized protein n=1 Tax=Suillus paluster TaxID=48578 RepID=UPI001B85B506|nr:uncharacterized protein EDB91DRAFT_1253789 [Suillus paluster]KAG1727661.1 hypothetical protein EDB91DRAFT_1253789 [Suillus paluster]
MSMQLPRGKGVEDDLPQSAGKYSELQPTSESMGLVWTNYQKTLEDIIVNVDLPSTSEIHQQEESALATAGRYSGKVIAPVKLIKTIKTSNNSFPNHTEFYQDLYTYEPSFTDSTPLGAVESYQLGSYQHSTYLNPSSPSHISGIHADLMQNGQVIVHAKAGEEGTAVFDSAIAILQGLFLPNPNNVIELANGMKHSSQNDSKQR